MDCHVVLFGNPLLCLELIWHSFHFLSILFCFAEKLEKVASVQASKIHPPPASSSHKRESAFDISKEKTKVEPTNVGVGEVVEVQWHDKGEGDVVWHTKADPGVVTQENVINPETHSEKLHSNIVLTYQTEGRGSIESEALSDEETAQVNNKLETAFEDISPFDEKLTDSSQSQNNPSKSPALQDVSSVSSILEALDALFNQKKNRPGEKKKFDPQDLLTHIRYNPQYSINASWINSFESLSCDLQPFLQRWSMSGEFFAT